MTSTYPLVRLALKGALTAAALLLAGCAAPFNGPEQATTPETRYPITVAPQMRRLSVPYASGAGLTPELDQQVSAFASKYLDQGNGAIAIAVPPGQTGAEKFFTHKLVALGVKPSRILAEVDNSRSARDGVELSYIGYQADTLPCGDWSKNLADTSSNETSPNFGCATQQNLAAMVADPRDLARPRTLDPGDVQRTMVILDKYRKGEPTAAQMTPEQSGAVSEVGQSQ